MDHSTRIWLWIFLFVALGIGLILWRGRNSDHETRNVWLWIFLVLDLTVALALWRGGDSGNWPDKSYDYGYNDSASQEFDNELRSDGLLSQDSLLTCDQLYGLDILYRGGDDFHVIANYRSEYLAGCQAADSSRG